MRSRLFFLIKYILFWLLFSVAAKGLFLLWQYPESSALHSPEVFLVFWKGLRIDLSLAGYVALLSCVLLAVGTWVPGRWVNRIFAGLTGVLLAFFGLVVVGDLEVFANWGYHVDATPLLYLSTPGEMLSSLTAGRLLLLVVVWILLVGGFYLFYRWWVARSLRVEMPAGKASGKRRCWQPLVWLLLGGSMMIPIRGGFNVAPMNVSFVFFSTRSLFANQAAINPVWNFLYEATHLYRLEGDFDTMPRTEALAKIRRVNQGSGTFVQVVDTTRRPNVVVLLLETFTMNGWEAMPNVRKAAREGVLFSRVYATGNRSDRGLLGTISGFPAHPLVSLLGYPAKTYELPRFSVDFREQGYHTAFHYAGDLNFGGFRSYVTMSFQEQVTEADFSGEAIKNRFKWGVHDQYMLERLYDDLRKAPSPHLTMAFTMSSHEPFEVPGEVTVPGTDSGSRLRNSIAYTDRCLGDFFGKCKESGIWDNTLFVLVADHGTRHIGNITPSLPEAFHIPLIFTGGAMQVRDSVVETIGSQTDLATTLLAQLGMDTSRYRFGKNLLDPGITPFAFYAYSGAAGVVLPEGAYVLDLKSGRVLQESSNPLGEEIANAYLQEVDHIFKDSKKPS